MNARRHSEADLAQLILNRDRDPIERVRGKLKNLDASGGSHARPAGSKLAPSLYRSKWEEQMAYECTIEKRAELIKDWGYETMTLKLGPKAYHRPDFTIWHLTGAIELRQVKGWHKNLRASMVALKWAAQTHPWYAFTLWRRQGRGWDIKKVEA